MNALLNSRKHLVFFITLIMSLMLQPSMAFPITSNITAEVSSFSTSYTSRFTSTIFFFFIMNALFLMVFIFNFILLVFPTFKIQDSKCIPSRFPSFFISPENHTQSKITVSFNSVRSTGSGISFTSWVDHHKKNLLRVFLTFQEHGFKEEINLTQNWISKSLNSISVRSVISFPSWVDDQKNLKVLLPENLLFNGIVDMRFQQLMYLAPTEGSNLIENWISKSLDKLHTNTVPTWFPDYYNSLSPYKKMEFDVENCTNSITSRLLTRKHTLGRYSNTSQSTSIRCLNQNHICLVRLNSIACISMGMDLRSDVSFTSWIDHDQKNLQVCLTSFKPESLLLNGIVMYFQEQGFKASTDRSNLIQNLIFKSFGIKRFNPIIDKPDNASTNTVPTRFLDDDHSSLSCYNNYCKRIEFSLYGCMFIFAHFGYIKAEVLRSQIEEAPTYGCEHTSTSSTSNSNHDIQHKPNTSMVKQAVNQKRDFKLKSLRAAEAAKRSHEKKENERRKRRQDFKIELARRKEERANEMKLILIKEEEDLKRKEKRKHVPQTNQKSKFERKHVKNAAVFGNKKKSDKPGQIKMENEKSALKVKVGAMKFSSSEESSYIISPCQINPYSLRKFVPSWASDNLVAMALPLQQKLNPESVFCADSFCSINDVLLPLESE